MIKTHPKPNAEPFTGFGDTIAGSSHMCKNAWMKFVSTVFVLAFALGVCSAAETVNVIPKPVKMEMGNGHFTLTDQSAIEVTPSSTELEAIGKYLARLLAPASGITLAVKPGTGGGEGSIALKLDSGRADLGDEGYEFKSTKNGITIVAAKPAGVFYGVQTLRQLLPVEIESGQKIEGVAWTVPCVSILDKPRFGWRGLMLDPVRHFIPKEEVLKFIDAMALNKLNRLHLHLTDDQGWRIEIKRYPKLSEISAWRGEGNERHGGIYTQEDIREIVQYAASRYVMVIPEIEMPGHATAALAAFPELSCSGGPFQVVGNWGIFKDVYCAGNEKTFEFLQNVLSEVMPLFPAPYLHIGGDECPKEAWKKCPKCQSRIQEQKLKDEHELQSYFIQRMEKYVNAHGKTIIGWDEILEGGLAPNAIVQSWRGTKGGIAAAQANHDVIMSPGSHCYLDTRQGEDRDHEPKGPGKVPLTLGKVYSYEPVPAELTPQQAEHIMGLQGNLWSESIPTTDHLEYMAFPRASAIAEIGWSPAEGRSFTEFFERVTTLMKRWDLLGVNYRKPKEND